MYISTTNWDISNDAFSSLFVSLNCSLNKYIFMESIALAIHLARWSPTGSLKWTPRSGSPPRGWNSFSCSLAKVTTSCLLKHHGPGHSITWAALYFDWSIKRQYAWKRLKMFICGPVDGPRHVVTVASKIISWMWSAGKLVVRGVDLVSVQEEHTHLLYNSCIAAGCIETLAFYEFINAPILHQVKYSKQWPSVRQCLQVA